MTIGEKIARLRLAQKMSQEDLAERLEVSRQSVSKWEMNQATPQIGKVIELCDLFGIGTDELLREELSLYPAPPAAPEPPEARVHRFSGGCMIGEANLTLTSQHTYRVGRFLGWYFQSELSGCRKPGYRPRVVIGKDTRRSSYMLEYSLVAGLTASGANVYMLHVTSAPSVVYATRLEGFDCGVMISASLRPYYMNGLRLINRYGEMPDERMLRLLECYLDGDMQALGVEGDLPLAMRERIGAITDFVGGRNRYVGYLISLASHSYRPLRIGLDCANGAAWTIAKAVFDALGARTYVMGASPDGFNINDRSGYAYPDALRSFVLQNGLDAGFAFDGDAQVCLAIDESGRVLDQKRILLILARRMRALYPDAGRVATEGVCDAWLARALDASGIGVVEMPADSGSLYEFMQEHACQLGADAQGRIFFRKYAVGGDGIVSAILLSEQMMETKLPLSALSGFKKNENV